MLIIFYQVGEMNNTSASKSQDRQNPLLLMLECAVYGHDNSSQRKVFEELSNIEENPHSYLGFAEIAANPQIELAIRQMALLTLKSALKRNQDVIEFSEQQLSYMKQTVLDIEPANLDGFKNAQKSLISQLCSWDRKLDFSMLSRLLSGLSSPHSQWAIEILYTTFEDIRFQTQNMDVNQNSEFGSFINSFAAVFAQKISEPCKPFICKLIGCMNFLIKYTHQASEIRNKYLTCYLLPLLTHPSTDAEIVKQILDGLTELIMNGSHLLIQDQTLLSVVISYQNENTEVRKRWLSLLLDIFNIDSCESVEKFLNTLVPKILNCLAFTHEDEVNIKMEMDEEINPYDYEVEEGGDADEENLGGEKAYDGGYTLRRLAVMCLDRLIMSNPDEIWRICEPLLLSAMSLDDGNGSYSQKQCGVLLMGIIYQKMQQNLAFLEKALPLLISYINNQSLPQILRCTSLWTISKIAYLISREQTIQNEVEKALIRCLQAEAANQNKKNVLPQVNNAAYTALDEIVSSSEGLPKRINQIVECILHGIVACHSRSLYCMLNICGTLYQKHCQQIPQEITLRITHKLCEKWTQCSNNQSIMRPILECLVTIISSHPHLFTSLAQQIFTQAINLIMQSISAHQVTTVLRTIDLLSTLVALNIPSITSTLEASVQFHEQVVYPLVINDDKQIRNFGYGLIGDISRVTSMSNYAHTYMKAIAESIDKNNITSCSNGLTCMTDLILANSSQPWVSEFVSPVLLLATDKLAINNLHPVYGFNFAKIFGRLGSFFPEIGSKILSNNLKTISVALRAHETQKQTNDAFLGIFKMIQVSQNPSLMSFEFLVEAYLCYNSQDSSLDGHFHRILLQFRNNQTAESWRSFLRKPNFLPSVSRKIETLCS